ncbi:uncharacterized protein LOC119069598 [Bradysia coprophila]|uniref:uncharacterized protein LOC119069598 n=1 Tax=Bradysia coprophila TaxID=38358 RepID=UPI00187DB78A|nr:uncharacterized protein LOC119069598 [Bradysia coprophila]
MNKLFLGIFAITFILYGYSTAEPEPGTQTLANILTYFKTAELCGHVTQVYRWRDDFGKWDIRFKATLAEGENAETLCKCMYDYINQNNWLGPKTEKTCIRSPNCITLVLQGPSSPDYDPTKPPVVKPIAALCAVLKNFKTVDLGNRSCTSKCVPDGKFTRLELQCELTCESPSPTDARDMVIQYLNQHGLIAAANVTAKVEGKFVNVLVLGD